ncbi:hypothetical protein FQA39_LY01896 [Lamprigera yunnana]|nr:hypothetical protein FQA39_LY01896 [Lamprigera yunnana]
MYERLREEFKEKGCIDPKTISIAVQLYLDLCEVKKYWDVDYIYDESMQKFYFTANITKNKKPALFIPIEVSESVSFNSLLNLFEIDNKEKQIYVVIVSSDSTCVYYQISHGLLDPSTEKTDSFEKSGRIDAELRRNRSLVEQAALYGMSITLDKDKVGSTSKNSKSS